MMDYICGDCAAHFESLKEYLNTLNIAYTVNPRIVRGLDYYTRTVFEFVSTEIGAQGTVCGGGRYDKLVEEMGGPAVPALGFGLGIERLLLLIEAQKIELPPEKGCEIFIVSLGEKAGLKAASLASELRSAGISAQFDILGRSVKAQMKYADKINAAFTAVLGDDELEKGEVAIRDMNGGETQTIKLTSFADDFMNISVKKAAKSLQDALG
jgi:histidyl-tRNA synthetase